MSEQQLMTVCGFEWVTRLIGHVCGASIFLLPFAMGQAGIAPFMIILGMELYFTGNSLNFFCEMAPRGEGINHTNYFVITESYLTKNHNEIVHYLLRGMFIFDVVVCTAFYFKTTEELIYSPCLADTTNPKHRSAYQTLIFIGIFLFIVFAELVSEFLSRRSEESRGHNNVNSGHTTTQAKVEVKNCNVEQINVQFGEDSAKAEKVRESINMHTVVQRLYGYSRKRYFLLLLFTFLAFAQFQVLKVLWKDERIEEWDSSQCTGLLKPFIWPGLSTWIFHIIPVIIFSLMHYAIFLPICLEELSLELNEYKGLVTRASIVLFIILLTIPLLVHLTLGESAPILFTTAYGCSMYGKIMNAMAIAICCDAMLLRVMACCRLIQVLFKLESDSHFCIIAICLFMVSSVLASSIDSVLYLVIIAGSINCNVLLIIIPGVTYIRFKLQQENSCIDFEIVQVGVCVAGHVLLLLTTIAALIFANPNVGQYCHEFFHEYWS